MAEAPSIAARFGLTGGDAVELTDWEGAAPAGVLRRLAPGGWARWVVDPGEGDAFVDARLMGDEVVAVSWRGSRFRIGLDDGVVRETMTAK